jgi:putative ATP-dependent endonuclease of OLD family
MSAINPEEKRKINREVMNTRGELIFSKAIILSEGETEEQALPIFAKKYWGKYPFELGLNFIGVGGQGNYKPFLKVAESFNIKWFIFSDGEIKTVKSVQKQIVEVLGTDFNIEKSEDVIILDNGKNFENYLIDSSYIKELIQAINEVEAKENWFQEQLEKKHDTEGRRRKTEKICPECKQNIFESEKRNYSGAKGEEKALYDFLIAGKTKYGPKIGEIISSLDGDEKSRRFPPKVKDLFEKISALNNFKIDQDNL